MKGATQIRPSRTSIYIYKASGRVSARIPRLLSHCRLIAFALSLLTCSACAPLATVKTTQPRVPVAGATDPRLELARRHLAAAEREDALAALGQDLSAAKLSLSVVEERPNESAARDVYNFSVARAIENVGRANLHPWQHEIRLAGDREHYNLTSPKPSDPLYDPGRYDLFATDRLKVGGKFFTKSEKVNGLGAPLVAVARRVDPKFRQNFQMDRIYASITAVVRFSAQDANLEFIDPLDASRVTLGKRAYPLAMDLHTPIAMLIARERPDRLGFSGLIDPDKYAANARLIQSQRYDSARTPVIFIHGLQDTPVSWVPMAETLRNDPWIRQHYQFWFYSYPSGYPYPYSAALFRHDLDQIDRAFSNHKRVVLVGHSMGGLICRLMITDSGDKIWRDFFASPPNKTPLAAETRKIAEDVFIFRHRSDVRRVIFISTPHRGSNLATSWIGRIGSSMVRTPQRFNSVYASAKPLLVNDPAARTLNRMPNSVDTLEPNDRFVQAVNKLPIASGVPYHSIMGDRGRGDTPNSSDGVVPYWSSHLDGAESEKIVPSDHSANRNPEAIAEVLRILKQYNRASHHREPLVESGPGLPADRQTNSINLASSSAQNGFLRQAAAPHR